MKKFGLGMLAIVLTMSAGAAMAAEKPFGTPTDVKFGNLLWKKLEDARLVGKNAFLPMPYETAPPHGKYVLTADGELTVKGRTGIVIVKKNLGKSDDTTLEQVADNPDKFIKSITVMFKREKGYDPKNKDWFWAKYAASGKLMSNPKKMALAGRVAKGSDKGCIACHSLAPGGDYVYIHDRYAK